MMAAASHTPPPPPAIYAPAMESRPVQSPLQPAGVERWHIGYTLAAGYIVLRTLATGETCCEVRPTLPGLMSAAKLADALNRAFGIDPLEGFDARHVLHSLTEPTRGARRVSVSA